MRGVHWFRGDLRLRDNTALAALARECDEIGFVFVLDERLLASPRTGSARVRFLLDCVERLAKDLDARGHTLHVLRGEPEHEMDSLLARAGADCLSFNG